MSVIIERRLGLRLLAYWEKRRQLRAMPQEADILPEDLNDFWNDCFMVSLSGPDGVYNLRYRGARIDAQWPLADAFAASVAIVKDKCIPLLEEGAFRNSRGEIVKYRQCLLPLGDEATVTAIFGGVRFKAFP